jgi:hypothetical protein
MFFGTHPTFRQPINHFEHTLTNALLTKPQGKGQFKYKGITPSSSLEEKGES